MPKIETSDGVTTITYSDDEINETKKYWTDEKIKSAQPIPLPTYSDDEFQELLKKLEKNTDTSEEKESKLPAASGETAQLVEGQITLAPIGRKPFSFGGKLLFTTSDNLQGSCSAEWIMGPNDTPILMTAAHCLYDLRPGIHFGKMFTNFKFIQGYDFGKGNEFEINVTKKPQEWTPNNPNPVVDFAFMKTKKPPTGSGIGYHVGAFYPPSNVIKCTAIGYPSSFMDGACMGMVNGSAQLVAPGLVLMKNNSMKKGSSGGAWLIDNGPNSSGTAIGLNSGGNGSQVFGPYFGKVWTELYEKMAGS